MDMTKESTRDNGGHLIIPNTAEWVSSGTVDDEYS